MPTTERLPKELNGLEHMREGPFLLQRAPSQHCYLLAVEMWTRRLYFLSLRFHIFDTQIIFLSSWGGCDIENRILAHSKCARRGSGCISTETVCPLLSFFQLPAWGRWKEVAWPASVAFWSGQGLTDTVSSDAVEAEVQVFQEILPFVHNKASPCSWAFGCRDIAAPGNSSWRDESQRLEEY